MNRRLQRLEWIGIPVCFGLAVLFHQLFEWTGGARVLAWLVPVNESVWEHTKLLVVPYLLWAAVEYAVCRPPLRAFFTAKIVAVYGMVLGMIGFFYVYTAQTGAPIQIIDMLSALVWQAIGFVISAWALRHRQIDRWFPTAVAFAALYGACTVICTWNPPQWTLFRDLTDGSYGIPVQSVWNPIPV